MEVLNRHPEISILNEPFNENFASWELGNTDFCARLPAGEDFETIMNEIFAEFTGIKEHSYQLDDHCLDHLVRRPDVGVIVLRRGNLVQTALSQVVAEQTGLWKTWDAVGPLEDHYRDLGPIDVDTVADRIRWTVHEVARLDSALATVDPAQVFRVSYEDLYFATPLDQDILLAELWAFLELPPCFDPAMRHYLSDGVRQARRSTYGRIPNLDEIEATFGDDATGHLEQWTAKVAE